MRVQRIHVEIMILFMKKQHEKQTSEINVGFEMRNLSEGKINSA